MIYLNKAMKKSILFPLFAFLFLFIYSTKAQNLDSPGEYLTYINSVQKPIQEDYMTYASTVARGKSAKKVENKRKELIQSVNDARNKVKALPAYKGDKSYRDSTVKFLNMAYTVLNEDYSKIIDMEAVAEQSYDAMEAYYLAQDMAGDKLDKAGQMTDTAFYIFAKKYNVTIQNSSTSQLAENVKKASAAMAYQRKLYLIFFKPFKQEAYLWDAINKKNLSGVEQNKNSLISLATEALKVLDTTKSFKNDRTLITVTKEFQNFYLDECKTKISLATDLILKEEEFAKTKKAFDAKSQSDRKQEDVDAFNKSVNEYNKAATNYNVASNTLNNQRNALLTKWNNASQNFLDAHVPKK
jgi:hypothetical protein